MKGYRMENKPKKLTKLYIIIVIFLLIIALLSAFILLSFPRGDEQVSEIPDGEKYVGEKIDEEIVEEPVPPVMRSRFYDLYEQNDHIIGWIRVPGTNINYPVVQGDDNLFYLHHDLDRRRSAAGTIFLYASADVLENNRNLSLFGHYMRNGTKFSALHNYLDIEHYRRFPIFAFDNLYEDGLYKIFSVFYMAGSSADALFYYYITADFPTDEDFAAHINQLLVRSIFITTVDVDIDDRIVILTVCTYETYDLRLAVAGRRIRPGESLLVNTEDAILNPEPLFPQRWYNAFGGEPPAHILESL